MLNSDRGGGLVHFNDGDAKMHHDQEDRTGRGFSTSINTMQEARHRGILRVSPEKKAWLPSDRVLDCLSDTVNGRYRIRIFDSSILHKLDSSASDFRTEHDFFVTVVFKHRWYSKNHKRDGESLTQA